MSQNVRVKNVEHLKELCNDCKHDYFIQLQGCKSSKYIDVTEDDIFCITNEIDGSHQDLFETDLMNSSITNIGIAIEKGNFYCYE